MTNQQAQMINLILILAVLAVAVFFVFRLIKKMQETEDVEYENAYSEKHIVQVVAEIFASMMKTNLKEMNMSRRELELKNAQRNEMRTSLREAASGNREAKRFIVSSIKGMLTASDAIGMTEDHINDMIHFNSLKKLTPADKTEICIYLFNKKYGEDGLIRMIEKYHLDAEKRRPDGNTYFEITDEDMTRVYLDLFREKGIRLSADDKYNIIAQRIFEKYKGLDIVDLLADSTIDECDGGVSGIPKDSYAIRQQADLGHVEYSYQSVWITVHGKNIRMSCLPFASQDDLIRVCQNIYKYNAPASLSRRNGAVVSTMKDGSRIVVARPPFCDSWAFFMRKFDSTPSIAPQDLFADPGSEYVVTMIRWLIMGHRNIMITGSQGTGKTTTLKSVLRFVPEALTLRIQEKAFEMNLRYVYPERNIVTFQETETISMQEGLNLQKKTNGSVNVFGEIASREASDEYLQTCRVASLFGIGTHHAKTTRDLVRSFAVDGETEETVSQTINFDIHMENAAGHRFCQRITEIIPIRDRRYPSEVQADELTESYKEQYKKAYAGTDRETMEHAVSQKVDQTLGAKMEKIMDEDTMEFQKRMTDRMIFETRDIIIYRDGAYHVINRPTKDSMDAIAMNLPEDLREEFVNAVNSMPLEDLPEISGSLE